MTPNDEFRHLAAAHDVLGTALERWATAPDRVRRTWVTYARDELAKAADSVGERLLDAAREGRP